MTYEVSNTCTSELGEIGYGCPLPGTLPTPPSMRGRTRRFQENEQVPPRGVSDSRHPAKLTNRSSSRHHLRSSWPMRQGPLRLLPCRIAYFCGSVALPQLPSPRACSLVIFIWYTDLLEIPISHRGLKTHKPMPMTGVPKAMYRSGWSTALEMVTFFSATW